MGSQTLRERPGLGDTAQSRAEGAVCVWFAASEHLGFPEPHQGFWGMKLVGQAWELSAPLRWLRAKAEVAAVLLIPPFPVCSSPF